MIFTDLNHKCKLSSYVYATNFQKAFQWNFDGKRVAMVHVKAIEKMYEKYKSKTNAIDFDFG